VCALEVADTIRRWTDIDGLKLVTSADQARRVEALRKRAAEREAAPAGDT
jgi:hypothetical protein